MTVLINASTTNGLQMTSDGSGIVKLQSNSVTTNALAWVNFNPSSGSSAVIRSSYNVSSVTYSATGSYVVNFTVATSDANYATLGTASGLALGSGNSVLVAVNEAVPPTTSAVAIQTRVGTSGENRVYVNVAIFGN